MLELALRLPLDRFELQVDLATSTRVTGIFGASGSGKTSLLEAVAGLRPRARGRVVLERQVWLDSGRRVRVPPEAREVGYVPQDALLFPDRDVAGNLWAGAWRARRSGTEPERRRAFQAVVEMLELGELLGQDPATLSGGEAQRVALGRALLSAPRLLLLDEPFASLDLGMRRRLLPYLRRVRDQTRVPMLLVSHDPTPILALCDELVVLDRGRLVAQGAPRDVLWAPAVFPLTREEAFENVLAGTLVESRDMTSRIRLRPGVELVTPQAPGSPGAPVLVGIPAREILVATSRPRGLSAQNVLRARIVELHEAGGVRLVRASLGEGVADLVAEITAQAAASLGLVPDREVYLVIKATGCAVYAAPVS